MESLFWVLLKTFRYGTTLVIFMIRLTSLSCSEVLWETLDLVDLSQCNGPARYIPVRFSFALSSKPTGSIHISLKKLPRLWEIKECVVFAFFICRTGTDTLCRYYQSVCFSVSLPLLALRASVIGASISAGASTTCRFLLVFTCDFALVHSSACLYLQMPSLPYNTTSWLMRIKSWPMRIQSRFLKSAFSI